MAEQFAESANNVIIEEVNKGLNPGMIVLLVVATTLLLSLLGTMRCTCMRRRRSLRRRRSQSPRRSSRGKS
eukprot:UN07697